MEVFKPACGVAAPALEPAIKLYTLLHDILSPEAQNALCHYFQVRIGCPDAKLFFNIVKLRGLGCQVAARKRSRRHLTETDEYISNNTDGALMDNVTLSTAYQKMKSVCVNVRNEILTDIEIHNTHILPRYFSYY